MARLVLLWNEHENESGASREWVKKTAAALRRMGHEVRVRPARPLGEEGLSPVQLITKLGKARTASAAFEILDAFRQANNEQKVNSYDITMNAAKRHRNWHVLSFHTMESKHNNLPSSAAIPYPWFYRKEFIEIDGVGVATKSIMQAMEEERIINANSSIVGYAHVPAQAGGRRVAAVVECKSEYRPKDNVPRALRTRAAMWGGKWQQERGLSESRETLDLVGEIVLKGYLTGQSVITPGSHYDDPAHAGALARKIHELVTQAEAHG